MSITLALTLSLLLSPSSNPSASDVVEPFDLVVHEWGTFTTIVAADGTALHWHRPAITEPLPRFVHMRPGKLKGTFQGTVRMETPVIYFHTDHPMQVDVQVDFPAGRLTEWYPSAVDGEHGLRWDDVQLHPDGNPILPTEHGGDHYYAARGVAAAPVRVSLDEEHAEDEKFLFYRGIGTFDLPLFASVDGDSVAVRNDCEHRIDQVMLFERRGDQLAYTIRCYLAPGEEHRFDREELSFSAGLRLDDLKKILRGQGLREDEAQSMVDTWRHTWFEEGLRALYTVPAEVTDAVLPLAIEPEPRSIRRALIGRTELVTESMREELLALTKQIGAAPQSDVDLLQAATDRFGRFALAVLAREINLPRDEHSKVDPELMTGYTRWNRWQTRR